MSIKHFISHHDLLAGDVVELICPILGFPKYYAIYIGDESGEPTFVANITDGVCAINGQRLTDFIHKYHVTRIDRFTGTSAERKTIVRKAVKSIGQNAYHLIFNNCEHFKNWVLHDNSVSRQVVHSGLVVIGTGLLFVCAAGKKKGLERIGVWLVLVALVVFIVGGFLASMRRSDPGELDPSL
jgi:hypothetical protein